MTFQAPSYTKLTHSASYPAIDPTQPSLSTDGKVVLITGASGGIGRATASAFAASNPRALILLGRRPQTLNEIATLVHSNHGYLVVQTHEVDLCNAPDTRNIMKNVADELGGIDILVHCAGALAPVVPLLDEDPSTFLDGYKTTVVGTLITAQSVVLANKNVKEDKEITFINLTTAGILFPPFLGMGAYVSSKMAAVKLLQSFATENPHMRLHNVHPGFLDTAMSTQLAKTTKLPFAYDDSTYRPGNNPPYNQLCKCDTNTLLLLCLRTVSLPADFLVWVASREADFLRGKLVFSAWDVEELKARKKEIASGPPGTGELWIGLQGFPRFIGGEPLPRTR